MLKFCLYAILIILGIVFSVENHTEINLTFFPLPYALSIPIFLFAIVVFLTGAFLGWSVARLKGIKYIRHGKAASKRVHALENELSAIRSEKLIKQR